MRIVGAVAVAVAASATWLAVGAASAQERDVPKDSERVSIRGCARDRTFIVGPRSEDQQRSLEIAPGRRFRLSGEKKLLDDIKARQQSVIEITGLIRKADVSGPSGISVLGGRVRIGGARTPQDPISDPRRDPAYNQPVLDVEAWRVMPGDCPQS
jgi:hypothetical protein